jgi:hypothetical protein
LDLGKAIIEEGEDDVTTQKNKEEGNMWKG